MARVKHVKKARKDVPSAGIAAGDEYWYVKFRFGGKRYFKQYPRRSQTTQSAFYSTLWEIEDGSIAGLTADEILKDQCEAVAQELRDLAQECQDSLDNMPEGLQQGSTGEMLQERIDALEAAADEFDEIDFDNDREDGESDEDFWDRKLQEACDISIDAP